MTTEVNAKLAEIAQNARPRDSEDAAGLEARVTAPVTRGRLPEPPPSARFCEHGVGVDFACRECGPFKRKGVRDVPWDDKVGAYIVRGHQETAQEAFERLAKVPVETGGVTPIHSHVTDPKVRKMMPLISGCLHYFPDALAYVAYVSYVGNQQHNPGEPLHWARGKSMDHVDAAGRHLTGLGKFDTDRVLHAGKLAWRSLANLQHELEALYGLPLPPNATEG